jgi:hypothetical protein
MNQEKGSWYLLTAIILGIGLGVLYSWMIFPAEYVDTPPLSLRNDFKDRYRSVIAAAYEATGDLQRANARLALLQDDDPSLALVVQAQRYLAEGDDYANAQALANLASALGQAPTPLPTQPDNTPTDVSTNTPELPDPPTPSPSPTSTVSPTSNFVEVLTSTLTITPTQEGTSGPTPTPTISRTPRPTSTPTRTYTPTPTRTPTSTLAPPFVLDNRVEVCNLIIGEPQLQIFVANSAGVGIPGVEIVVAWDGGEDHFFTGLKPDIDIGYADFVMTPEVLYSLRVGDGAKVISDLMTPPCTNDEGDHYWGSVRLVFSHP